MFMFLADSELRIAFVPFLVHISTIYVAYN